MATVNAGKYGWIYSSSESGWNPGVRSASTGSSMWNQSTSTNINNIRTYYEANSFPTLPEWTIVRSFFAFDVTAYQTGYTITDLKLYYLPTTSTAGSGGAGMKIAIVKSTAQGNANADLALTDFNNFDDTVDYALNDGSAGLTWRDLATLQSFDLNATGVTAITGTGYLKLCIMEYIYDYTDTAPTISGTDMKAYGNFSTVPYLSFTATATVWSYGDIDGTTSPEEKINAIAYTDINSVNNIPITANFEANLSGGGTYTVYYTGALDSLFSGSILYSNSSGATALPAGSYSPVSVTVFGCTAASGCSYCIIDSNGLITSSSPPCCP